MIRHTLVRVSIVLSAVALAAITLCAQGSSDWFAGKKQWVTVVSAPTIKIAPNGNGKAIARFMIAENMHINSHTPKSDLLIPTVLSLSPPKGVTAKEDYPAGHMISLSADPNEKLDVYTGEFAVTIDAIGKGLTPGKFTIPAKLDYQACNASSCFPPKTLTFNVEVEVAR